MHVPLTNRRHEVVGFATIDPENFAWLSGMRWHRHRGYAAHTLRNGSKLLMHREIIGAKPGVEVHHKNGDRLDNRRANLMLTTKAEHQHQHAGHGESGFRGVCRGRNSPRWVGRVKHKGKMTHLGTFDTPEDASAVVEAWWAAKRLENDSDPQFAGR